MQLGGRGSYHDSYLQNILMQTWAQPCPERPALVAFDAVTTLGLSRADYDAS